MVVRMIITNYVFVLSATLVLVLDSPAVNGIHLCESKSPSEQSNVCEETEYCCGTYENVCCKITFIVERNYPQGLGILGYFSLFCALIVLICCPITCYHSCCKRTATQGVIYSQPDTTKDVTIALPPEMNQVPYPTVVPYPQQTPNPPQPQNPNNPYYGVPSPVYEVIQPARVQQASVPEPYFQS